MGSRGFNLIEWSVRHPSAVLAFYTAVIVLTIWAVVAYLPRRMMPYIESPQIGIVTRAPGLSAEDMILCLSWAESFEELLDADNLDAPFRHFLNQLKVALEVIIARDEIFCLPQYGGFQNHVIVWVAANRYVTMYFDPDGSCTKQLNQFLHHLGTISQSPTQAGSCQYLLQLIQKWLTQHHNKPRFTEGIHHLCRRTVRVQHCRYPDIGVYHGAHCWRYSSYAAVISASISSGERCWETRRKACKSCSIRFCQSSSVICSHWLNTSRANSSGITCRHSARYCSRSQSCSSTLMSSSRITE
jgi:hypothetical protein